MASSALTFATLSNNEITKAAIEKCQIIVLYYHISRYQDTYIALLTLLQTPHHHTDF